MADYVYGGGTILQSPLFIEFILPFILVFAIVFAVLQKSEVLGKDKKQVDAMVAFAVGLITIAFGQAVGIIIQLSVFLSVGIVVFLVLMILMGIWAKPGDFESAFKKFRTLGGIVSIIAVVITVMIVTGAWDYLYANFVIGGESSFLSNVVAIAVVVIAVAFVWFGAKDSSDSAKDDK